MAARKIVLCRSVPEIHKPVAGTLSNQPTNKPYFELSEVSPIFKFQHYASVSWEWIFIDGCICFRTESCRLTMSDGGGGGKGVVGGGGGGVSLCTCRL